MQEVVIDSLTVTDFGPFYGENELDFRTVEDQRGILIGGKNGAGKTHLLRAIYLAVVGEKGMYDLKALEKEGSGATKFRFDQSLNRKAASQGQFKSSLKISLRKRNPFGGSESWSIARTITHKEDGSGQRWASELIKPDGTSSKDDDEIQRLRDTLLPRHLARFFFFDAERSQDLHLSSEEIVTGISRILGLWAYEELAKDLRSLMNNKIPQLYQTRSLSDSEKKLFDSAAEITRTSGYIKSERDKQGDLEEELREIEQEIHRIEEDLRILGSIDQEEIERLRQRREEKKTARDEYLQRLNACWELELPLALLGGFRNELSSYLTGEERRGEWERSKDYVEPKIPEVKSDVFENVPEAYALADDVHAFYLNRLDSALRRIFHPPPTGIPDTVFVIDRADISSQVRHLLTRQLEGFSALMAAVQEIESLESDLRELDSTLRRSAQDAETLVRCGELKSQLKAHQQRTDEIGRQLSDSKAEQARLETSLVELKRQEENQTRVVDKAKMGKTLASIASRYREVSEEVQKKAAVALRSQIGDQVGSLWTEIADREHEFLGLEFDEHWNCHLVKRGGQKIPWDGVNTSAGQQQVRMLAFYEALRRMASLVPPLVVDTPLGRLDNEVRASVMERVYLSGHQSIILATNSEIDPGGKLFRDISNRLARVYTLEARGEPDSPDYVVHISDGYFGSQL